MVCDKYLLEEQIDGKQEMLNARRAEKRHGTVQEIRSWKNRTCGKNGPFKGGACLFRKLRNGDASLSNWEVTMMTWNYAPSRCQILSPSSSPHPKSTPF